MKPTDNTPHTIGAVHDAPECEAGAHARNRNEPLNANPHPVGTTEYCQWAAGWRRPGMYIGDEPSENN